MGLDKEYLGENHTINFSLDYQERSTARIGCATSEKCRKEHSQDWLCHTRKKKGRGVGRAPGKYLVRERLAVAEILDVAVGA